MANEDKKKTGLTTFLVLLSALGMLAIVIALGFAFFYPGVQSGQTGDQPSLSSLLDRSENIGPSSADPSSQSQQNEHYDNEDSEISDALLESLDQGEYEDIAPQVAEPDLDDTDALIDSLMSDSSLEDQANGENLNIQFDATEIEEPVVQESTSYIEDSRPVQAEPEPVRYETRERDIFWIQVASFPNSIKAEEMQIQLQAQGISSTIHTKDVNGTFYYRVRIGAFNSRNEAENFNQQIMALQIIDETTIYTSSIEETVAVE